MVWVEAEAHTLHRAHVFPISSAIDTAKTTQDHEVFWTCAFEKIADIYFVQFFGKRVVYLLKNGVI